MNEEEKKLLDYLYTVGQQVQDYMRRNGYMKYDTNHASIDILVDKDDKMFDSVKAWYFTANKGEPIKAVRREFDIVNQESVYKEV